jgi:hypothetical protein
MPAWQFGTAKLTRNVSWYVRFRALISKVR